MKYIIKSTFTLVLAVLVFSLILDSKDSENLLSLIQIMGLTMFIFLFIYSLDAVFTFLIDLVTGKNKLEFKNKVKEENE